LELLEEAEHAEVLGVGGVVDGEEAAVLGVEDEDEAQQDGEEAAVEVVVLGVEGFDGAAASAVAVGGGLEAGEQDLERLEDLAGELFGDVGLAAAALGRSAGKRARSATANQAVGRVAASKRVEDRAGRRVWAMSAKRKVIAAERTRRGGRR
jgi:hypothetical protein